jgi:hypothetical protein
MSESDDDMDSTSFLAEGLFPHLYGGEGVFAAIIGGFMQADEEV